MASKYPTGLLTVTNLASAGGGHNLTNARVFNFDLGGVMKCPFERDPAVSGLSPPGTE